MATNLIGEYQVSPKMEKIWKIELDILAKFISVCDKHGLKYQMIGGTLLGAVRHKGFIPWDNDIDIVMPRYDYNKLLEIGQEAFDEPYFFQTPETELSRYFMQYVKIRHSNSTAVSFNETVYKINGGIFIDVFCMDELPDGFIQRKYFIWKLNEIAKMGRFVMDIPLRGGLINNIKHSLQRFVYHKILRSPNSAELFKICNRYSGRYAGKGCREVTTLWSGYRKNIVWQKSDWEDSVMLDFENLRLPAPKGYDAILKCQYGDYWKIPEDKGTHDYYIFDPDVSYKVRRS